jgi:hypothetical protein
METVKTIAVNVAVAAVLSVIMIWGHTFYRQQVQFDKGEQGRAAGNFIAAVAGYESALHMYTPFSPTIDRSAQKLWELAESAERGGDVTRALVAYRSLRSSFYAAAGLFNPGTSWIKRCDAKIAQLVPLQGR